MTFQYHYHEVLSVISVVGGSGIEGRLAPVILGLSPLSIAEPYEATLYPQRSELRRPGFQTGMAGMLQVVRDGTARDYAAGLAWCAPRETGVLWHVPPDTHYHPVVPPALWNNLEVAAGLLGSRIFEPVWLTVAQAADLAAETPYWNCSVVKYTVATLRDYARDNPELIPYDARPGAFDLVAAVSLLAGWHHIAVPGLGSDAGQVMADLLRLRLESESVPTPP